MIPRPDSHRDTNAPQRFSAPIDAEGLSRHGHGPIVQQRARQGRCEGNATRPDKARRSLAVPTVSASDRATLRDRIAAHVLRLAADLEAAAWHPLHPPRDPEPDGTPPWLLLALLVGAIALAGTAAFRA